MNIIVTGGAGFIGSNFVFHMLNTYPDYRIICVDKLTYAGNLSTLEPVMDSPNFRFCKIDICDRDAIYGLPVTISRCSNNYGPYHFPEKLIPLMIANALNDKPLPVYGKGENIRDWLYVEDHCRAIDLIIHKGRVGEVYNVGGHNEMKNIDIVKIICKELGKPESLITYVADRKGHDMRYAIDPTKIYNELGWLPETKFADGIKKTIKWYLDNKEWWETIISGEYQN